MRFDFLVCGPYDCVMLQKIMEYLNTTKRHPGKIFMKFQRDEGNCVILFCVCSSRVFTKFLGDPYYEPLAWFMIKSKIYKYNSVAHARIPLRFCCDKTIAPLGLGGPRQLPSLPILKAGREECTSSLNVS